MGGFKSSDKIYKLVFSLYDMKKEINKKANSHFDFVIKNNLLLNSKRSQGAIISVVLLILIVIASSVIVITFVIPFINDKLSSGDCLDVIREVQISSSEYTCYDSANTQMYVQISIGAVRDLIAGFSIELGGVASQSFKLINGTQVTNVKMYDNNPEIKLPEDNAATTYIFSNILSKPSFINVYPTLENEKSCGASDTLTIIESC